MADDAIVRAAKAVLRRYYSSTGAEFVSSLEFEMQALRVAIEPAKTSKLDAKFYGQIRKAKDDSIVPDDQWVVFLAKDNAFAKTLPHYRLVCLDMGCDDEQIAAITAMIRRMDTWRAAHPDLCKNPDAKGEKLLA